MGELYKKAMVVCAAIATFGGGAWTVVSSADSLFTSKVKAVVAADYAEQSPADVSTVQKVGK